MELEQTRRLFGNKPFRIIAGDLVGFVVLGAAAGVASAITLAGLALLLSGAA